MKKSQKIIEFLKKPERYRNLDSLGEGVAAEVHGVFDTYLRRVTARKKLNRTHMDNLDVVQAFVNEMILVAGLNHPGIMPVYDALLSDEGDPAYIMGLSEGESLNQIMQIDSRTGDGQTLPIGQAVQILTKISETLTYAHDRGVLHLDIKPENIILGQYGEVTIMDWGAARVYDQGKYTKTYSTEAGEIKVGSLGVENKDLVMGTPMYMSPEQLEGGRDELEPTSDIFSVGVMIYQMLTGSLPFRASTLKDMVDKICNHEHIPVNKINPDIPLNLSRLCDKMLQKYPPDRYQDFVEVRAAIDDFQRSAAGFPTKSFLAGDIIFREGDPSDYVCIVVSGRVRIVANSNGKETELVQVGPNQPFGELAALTGYKRTATAIAAEDSVIRIISRQEIETEIDKLSPWVGGIVSALTQRIIDMNIKLLGLNK